MKPEISVRPCSFNPFLIHWTRHGPHLNLMLIIRYYFLFQEIFVGSSSSSSIASPNYYNIYYTSSPGMTCSWQIETTKGYILQLTFDKMSIPSCSGCSCGYVKVRDGSTSSAPLLGTYCNGNYPSLVSSKGNQMFINYHRGRYSYSSFRATVRSKKGTGSLLLHSVTIVLLIVWHSAFFEGP